MFFIISSGSDRDGRFHSVSRFNDDLLQEIFTRDVFSLLLHKQLINLTLIQKILRWRHTGFHVHSKVRATSKQEAERVGKYMIRPILSLKRLSFDEAQGQVIYQYGKHSTDSEHIDYLEFIARVTSHIPDKGQVMIRYHGLYANAHRGNMRKTGADVFHVPIIEDEAIFVPSKCITLIPGLQQAKIVHKIENFVASEKRKILINSFRFNRSPRVS